MSPNVLICCWGCIWLLALSIFSLCLLVSVFRLETASGYLLRLVGQATMGRSKPSSGGFFAWVCWFSSQLNESHMLIFWPLLSSSFLKYVAPSFFVCKGKFVVSKLLQRVCLLVYAFSFFVAHLFYCKLCCTIDQVDGDSFEKYQEVSFLSIGTSQSLPCLDAKAKWANKQLQLSFG